MRLKRDLDSGRKRAAESGDSRERPRQAAETSIAVLYFENLSGVKEDEYFRDGITEDIITELSKIKGLQDLLAADRARLPRQAGDAGAGRPAARRGVRARRQPAPRRQPAAHQRAARGRADRLSALVRALRPRDAGRLRGAGRDRAQDRRGAADHAVAAGAGRRSPPSRPRTCRPTTSTCAARATRAA